jgi:hypothetical protein
MRKFFALIALTMLLQDVAAQDAKVKPKNRKKFHIGLLVSPAVDWFTTSTSGLELDAARVKFGAGITTEFAFADNYALTLGLEYKGAGGALAYDNAYYLSNSDNKLPFELETRNYRYDYINVPIMLKLMTNQIGYFTYFGQVGVDFSFLASAQAYDKGNIHERIDSVTVNITAKERDYTNVYGSSSFANIRLRVGAGAEWNFSGNTSLLLSVNYHHGFIDVLRDADSDAIANEEGIFYSAPGEDVTTATVRPSFLLDANLHYVSLNVGILF